MDVKATYLHGDIEEEIYVKPVKEFAKPEEKGKVWRLQKSMYGLKQSGRAWNKKLHEAMLKLRFTRTQADVCVYFKQDKKYVTIIAIYVDDLLILTSNEEQKMFLKNKLKQMFDMKDFGEVKHILGITITRDRAAGKIWLDQSVCSKRMFEKHFRSMQCKIAILS